MNNDYEPPIWRGIRWGCLFEVAFVFGGLVLFGLVLMFGYIARWW